MKSHFIYSSKRLLQLAMICVGLMTLSWTHALPVFNIATNDTTIFVLPGSDATITYTVQNISGIDMPQMRYFPPPTTTINSSSSTCNSLLAKGATCTLQLIFHAPTNVTGVLKLGRIGVCGYLGKSCSVPAAITTIHIVPPIVPQRAYITNSLDNTVTVIDTGTDTVVATAIPVGTRPVGLAVTATGSKVYVNNLIDQTVSVIATSNNTVIATITLPGQSNAGSFAMAMLPNGTKLYIPVPLAGGVVVIDTLSDTISTTITTATILPLGVLAIPNGQKVYVIHGFIGAPLSVINPATDTVIGTVNLGAVQTFALAALSNSSKLYVTTNANDVKVVSIASDTVITAVPVGGSPQLMGVMPNNAKIYVLNSIPNTVSVLCTGAVPTACAGTDVVIATVATAGTGLSAVSVMRNNAKVYITNSGTNNVTVLDTATDSQTPASPITVGGAPLVEAITSNSQKVYVPNRLSNDVSVINTATDTILVTIPLGNGPRGIVLTP